MCKQYFHFYFYWWLLHVFYWFSDSSVCFIPNILFLFLLNVYICSDSPGICKIVSKAIWTKWEMLAEYFYAEIILQIMVLVLTTIQIKSTLYNHSFIGETLKNLRNIIIVPCTSINFCCCLHFRYFLFFVFIYSFDSTIQSTTHGFLNKIVHIRKVLTFNYTK